MQTQRLIIGLGLVLALGAAPAFADDDADRGERHDGRRLIREQEYRYTVYDGGHRRRHRRHYHTAACRRVWVSGVQETITERQWVPGRYEEVIRPWKVEWIWVPRHHHREQLRVITDSPSDPPRRPNRRRYGRGYWTSRILQEEYVRREWVPGHYQTVARTVDTGGYYEFVCSRF